MLDVMPSRKWWKNSLAVQAAAYDGAFLATDTSWRIWSSWAS